MKKYILLFVLSLYVCICPIHSYRNTNNKELRILYIKQSEFNIELLKEYLTLTDSINTDIPIRQFILETEWFKSNKFIRDNNIAGMKYPKSRKTTAINSNKGYAVYKHWTCAVDDYMLWRNNWISRGYDISNYYKFLSDIGYAESKDYETILKQIKI